MDEQMMRRGEVVIVPPSSLSGLLCAFEVFGDPFTLFARVSLLRRLSFIFCVVKIAVEFIGLLLFAAERSIV